MRTPVVSIVIPTLNAASTLRSCLEHLRDVDFDHEDMEVIVADGGSTDGTLDIVAEFPFCRLVQSDASGPMAGRNDGFAHSKGEIVAYIDGDCAVEKDWLRNGIEALRSEDRAGGIGAVGGPIRIPRTSAWIGANGIFLALAYHAKFSVQSESYRSPREVSMIPTINFFSFRRVLERVVPYPWAGFGEDIELSERILALGLRLKVFPNVALWHYRRQSPAQFFWEMFNYARGRCHYSRVHRSFKPKAFLPHAVIGAVTLVAWYAASAGIGTFLAVLCAGYAAALVPCAWAGKANGYGGPSIVLAPFAGLVGMAGWAVGHTWELVHPSR